MNPTIVRLEADKIIDVMQVLLQGLDFTGDPAVKMTERSLYAIRTLRETLGASGLPPEIIDRCNYVDRRYTPDGPKKSILDLDKTYQKECAEIPF